MNESRTEAELIQLAQGGDRAAFELLAGAYRSRVAGVARTRLGERLRAQVEPDDVLQETFLRAWARIENFVPVDGDALFRWLAGIAVNVVREEAKRQPKLPRTGIEGDNADSAVSPLTAMRRSERHERLAESLQTLPEDYREIIVLTRFERLPPEEVARRMKRSPGACRALLLRALRALRSSFGDTESLGLPPEVGELPEEDERS